MSRINVSLKLKEYNTTGRVEGRKKGGKWGIMEVLRIFTHFLFLFTYFVFMIMIISILIIRSKENPSCCAEVFMIPGRVDRAVKCAVKCYSTYSLFNFNVSSRNRRSRPFNNIK